MKNSNLKIVLASALLLSISGCKKSESTIDDQAHLTSAMADSASVAKDEVSYAAKQEIDSKKFIKTAEVDMEVQDVYDATVAIEKSLKEMGGYVTSSKLLSHVLSEETFEKSDKEATLVKKYQTDNTMQVRVPTENLGDFLTFINNKKLFLNSRIITAEDVTNNAKIAGLEVQKLGKTAQVIEKMKNNGQKVELTESNLEQKNAHQIESLNLADNLKYSTVDIYIKEPKLRIAEIPIINTNNFDNKYKFNFFYNAKNALVEGFYLVQRVVVGLLSIWPLVLLTIGSIYLIRKKQKKTAQLFPNTDK